jgi:hypothetical protein
MSNLQNVKHVGDNKLSRYVTHVVGADVALDAGPSRGSDTDAKRI